MNPSDFSPMNREEREDYLTHRERERCIQEGSCGPPRRQSVGSKRNRRQVAAWMKGGLQEYLGDKPP